MPKQIWVVVDVETDGPCPGLYSMIKLGACVVENKFRVFRADFMPCGDYVSEEALKVTGFTHEQTLDFPHPGYGMEDFHNWLKGLKSNLDDRLVFVSDNLAFDWQFVNYYFYRFEKENPFGHSGRRIGDLWSGFNKTYKKNSDWKSFRKTPHTHDPVMDACGNVEALLEMEKRGLILPEHD